MSRTSKKTGATFLGVLMAVVILSLAILPMLSMLIDQTEKTTMSRDRMFATHLANSVIERLRLESYAQVKAYCSSLESGTVFINEDEWLNPKNAPKQYLVMVKRFNRAAVITEIGPRAGKLEAFVRWTEDGREREVSACTVLIDDDFPGGKP